MTDMPHTLCPPRPARLLPAFAVFALLLLASFALQIPTYRVADWQQIAFYDPGTVLKGDLLLSKGYIPTLDFGYTHGLLSLLYGRLGFSLLGRTPAAFWTLTLLCEIGMAWGFARLLRALRPSPLATLFLLVALPMAIMPAYLTLTHPLEAMLIILALAAQSEGQPSGALMLMTVCLFVKPSMAYVYGALLVGLLLVDVWRHRSFRRFMQNFLPAATALVGHAAILATLFGPLPVLKTLLPLTGAKTYAATGFGFFNDSGKALYLHQEWWRYIGTPVGMVLLGAAATFFAIPFAARQFFQAAADAPPLRRRRWELLATLAALHAAFLLGFYGWTGSWAYYSYLPIWILVLLLDELPRPHRKILAPLAIAAMLLSHGELLVVAWDGWFHKQTAPHTAGLWVYPDQWAAWQKSLDATAGKPTLIMSVGWIPDLPPNVSLPDAWFPEPGIPTPREIARIQSQLGAAQYVILWWEYRKFDIWNSADLAPERAQFDVVETNDFHWGSFIVLQRKSPPASPN